MKAAEPGRFAIIEKYEKKIAEGTTTDSAGRPLKIADEDMPVELEEGDDLYVWLFHEAAAAIPPQGTLPVPSEEDWVLERCGIRHPENQAYVRGYIRAMCAGRAEGLDAKFEGTKKPKPKKD